MDKSITSCAFFFVEAAVPGLEFLLTKNSSSLPQGTWKQTLIWLIKGESTMVYAMTKLVEDSNIVCWDCKIATAISHNDGRQLASKSSNRNLESPQQCWIECCLLYGIYPSSFDLWDCLLNFPKHQCHSSQFHVQQRYRRASAIQ